MNSILHIVPRDHWERAKRTGVYRSDTLDTGGFIHCSAPEQVIPVANAIFRGQTGLALLCIDPEKVRAPIRWEAPEPGGTRYPHIYGPLNTDAVVQVLAFEPGTDGTFALPEAIAGLP